MSYENREEYIKQAKKEFRNNSIYTHQQPEESEQSTYGYGKIRFIVAMILFFVIFAFQQTNDDKNIQFSETIVSMIERDLSAESVLAWFEE